MITLPLDNWILTMSALFVAILTFGGLWYFYSCWNKPDQSFKS